LLAALWESDNCVVMSFKEFKKFFSVMTSSSYTDQFPNKALAKGIYDEYIVKIIAR
jgi:hypothetical protein